jgi:ADP-glucose pyrophosphorylase
VSDKRLISVSVLSAEPAFQYLHTMPPNLENLQRVKQDQDSAVASNIDLKAQVSADSLVSSTTRVGERTSIKKSLIGRHCVIGKNVRLSNVIVWDFVNIADGSVCESCKQRLAVSRSSLSNCLRPHLQSQDRQHDIMLKRTNRRESSSSG